MSLELNVRNGAVPFATEIVQSAEATIVLVRRDVKIAAGRILIFIVAPFVHFGKRSPPFWGSDELRRDQKSDPRSTRHVCWRPRDGGR